MLHAEFVDTLCHLDFKQFDSDRETVLDEAMNEGVAQIVVPAVTRAGWKDILALCKQQACCFAALGLHPEYTSEHDSGDLSQLEPYLQQNSVAAIGEIGLDYFHKSHDREAQRELFSAQLSLARQFHLPVILHCRKAHDDCLAMLNEQPVVGGIVHAFNGNMQQAEKYIEAGFVLGFGGMLTYQRSSRLRRLAGDIPLENLVLETDAPDMTVAQYRGQRNSPAYLPLIAAALAEIKRRPQQEIAAATTANARRALPLLARHARATT